MHFAYNKLNYGLSFFFNSTKTSFLQTKIIKIISPCIVLPKSMYISKYSYFISNIKDII